MNKDNIVIESLEDYVQLILSEYTDRKVNAFYEIPRVFFRGQNRESYKLFPSLARKINRSSEMYSRFEYQMINAAKLQNPEEFTKDIYPINMLARMQHYGIPTRLLDVSENALVGLYFSCLGSYDYDGALFTFIKESKEVHTAYSLKANMLAIQYKFTEMTQTNIKHYWDVIKNESFIPTNESLREYDELEGHIKSRLIDPVFVLPEMSNERERRQQAAFIVFPNKLSNNMFTNEIRVHDELFHRKLIIKAQKKKRILKQLELLGITEHFLFPEVDKQCNAVKARIEGLVD